MKKLQRALYKKVLEGTYDERLPAASDCDPLAADELSSLLESQPTASVSDATRAVSASSELAVVAAPGFVQMGGFGGGDDQALPADSPAMGRPATRGFDVDDSDLGPLLLATLSDR